MKRLSIALAAAAVVTSAAAAPPKSFEEFRKGIMSSYQDFRSGILANYDKFLAGEWVAYEVSEPEQRDPDPKPLKMPEVPMPKRTAPTAPVTPPKPASAVAPITTPSYVPLPPKRMPDDDLTARADRTARPVRPDMPGNVVVPNLPDQPAIPDPKMPDLAQQPGRTWDPSSPTLPGNVNVPNLPDQPAIPDPKMPDLAQQPGRTWNPSSPTLPGNVNVPNLPDQPAIPDPRMPDLAQQPGRTAPDGTALPLVPTDPIYGIAPSAPVVRNTDKFDYYGMQFELPHVDFSIAQSVATPQEFSDQWKKLANAKIAQELAPEIEDYAEYYGLNPYMTFLMLRDWAKNRFADAKPSSRLSLVHYMMANLGYGVRIATTSDGDPIVLIPFEQMVYGQPYVTLNGQRYYMYGEEAVSFQRAGDMLISTCTLPDNTDLGANVDLRVNNLNLPDSPRPFEFKYGNITLTGTVNGNIMPLLYRYPQMEMGAYSQSVVDPALRAQLVSQLRSQLGGKSELDAVNSLLQFTQKAFEYATDDEAHGFEKPYFLEEMLYYPKCDCEDRSIFYTYFLWNVLGRPCQLINYPGHEAAAVQLSKPIEGNAYDHSGARWYISDPTYINAKTGLAMPNYKTVVPKVDFTYM